VLTRKLYGRVSANLGKTFESCEAHGIEKMLVPAVR